MNNVKVNMQNKLIKIGEADRGMLFEKREIVEKQGAGVARCR